VNWAENAPLRGSFVRVAKIRTPIVLLLLFSTIPAVATPSFGGTKIAQRWVTSEKPLPKLKRILVIAALENYLIRQELEDEMESLLAESGVDGIKSHMVLPPRDELTAEGELEEFLKTSDFDAILVIRPTDSSTETKETVGSFPSPYIPPQNYYSFWPYWHTTNGYKTTTESTVVRAEFNLYYTKDEKLLWSGETATIYSKDFGKLGREYAKTLVKQLKKDGVISPK
jgi:hypothetical protein